MHVFTSYRLKIVYIISQGGINRTSFVTLTFHGSLPVARVRKYISFKKFLLTVFTNWHLQLSRDQYNLLLGRSRHFVLSLSRNREMLK